MPTVQPFQYYSPLTIAPGESYHTNYIDIAMPPGKILIIEYVSGFGELPTGQKLTNVSVSTYQLPQPKDPEQLYEVPHFFIAMFTGNYQGTSDNYVVGACTRLYHSGERILLQANRNSTQGKATFNFALSGNFVDIPPVTS